MVCGEGTGLFLGGGGWVVLGGRGLCLGWWVIEENVGENVWLALHQFFGKWPMKPRSPEIWAHSFSNCQGSLTKPAFPTGTKGPRNTSAIGVSWEISSNINGNVLPIGLKPIVPWRARDPLRVFHFFLKEGKEYNPGPWPPLS